jgi:hypothetical protein
MKSNLLRYLFAAVLLFTARYAAAFNLVYSVSNPGAFTVNQRQILDAALASAEQLWESKITGYQPGISITTIPISVTGNNSGLASAIFNSSVNQGGFQLATSGSIFINVNQIETFSNFQTIYGTFVNVIDELMAHETGHVLGIGTLWQANGVYLSGTGQYTGQHGVAAFRAEFQPSATFVPVELAGNPGTPDAHWNQLMRSSVQEGNPSDPFSLDPRLGIVDQFGRDFSLELMTGAIDPDYGEPFLSNTTVQSLRDLGFTVTQPIPEPGGIMIALGAAALLIARRRYVTS